MLFIGICGASGSGKTTLTEELVREVGASSTVINQDAYYLDYPDLSFEERTRLNFDQPGIFDHELLFEDIKTLLSKQPITRKAYDFTKYERNDQEELVYPADVLIVEGIHAFYDERLCRLMFLKLLAPSPSPPMPR